MPFTKLLNNTVYGKTMVKLKERIDVKLVSNENDYLKWTSYMSQRNFGNDIWPWDVYIRFN